MCRIQFLLAVAAVTINVAQSWDLAVTNKDQIEFYTNGTKVAQGYKFGELTALAYDAVHNMLLFVDRQNDNASIFSYHLATKKYQPLVRKRYLYENIQGLAFDPVTSKLFWTDARDRSIYWISLAPGSKNDVYGNLLIKMDDEIPRAIAVDSCRGYIYWSNTNITNPTIERARFDGSERRVMINNTNLLYMPVSIAIDQHSRRMYWADDKEGIHFSIESSDLDGKDVQVELAGQHHQPNSLALSKDTIYWIDWGSKIMWKLPKHGDRETEPKEVAMFDDETPFGIVANYKIEDQTRDVPECDKLAKLMANRTAINDTFTPVPKREGLYCLHGEVLNGKMACKCTVGYFGPRCESSVCQNYCLQGDCSVTSDGQPICRCKDGFSGERCEVNVCENYCLNDATCRLNAETKLPQCSCLGDYEGTRCEVMKIAVTETPVKPEVPCNCTNDSNGTKASAAASSEAQSNDGIISDSCDAWDPVRDPIMMVLGILCGALCVACAVLITKILHLKKRPRIKKRIIVNKNVTPLTARPDQCEITIENCCNMNICETPCFEPRSTIRPTLLDAKPGKEEKRNLIANMEQPDDF
ncbi:hypothetical protein JYU34_020834 [Plutella xylostella]|uniref:Protein cueball n=1 Tax=Plutella xylostella TaxID=51655 RepID=A0ABQ7PS36_PLUXY|nr:hypothetical protein JYU34_020834 [Plutella xylostella]